MANSTRAQLSTDSLSYFPNNSSQLITPQDLRDWLTNGIESFVTQKDTSRFQNAFYENKGSNITAGATTNLVLASGNFIHIQGTTEINNFGNLYAGARFILMFEDAANLRASANLIIPGTTSGGLRVAVPGDCCLIVSEGGGAWRIVGYFPAGGAGSGTITGVTAGTGLSGGGTSGIVTVSLGNITPDPSGSFTNADITVDAQGRITAASSGTAGGVTSVTGTPPIASTGGSTPAISIPKADASTDGYLDNADWTTFNNKGNGTITALTGDVTASGTGSVTATLSNTTVTPGAYTNTNITVDAQGRITAASNGSGGGGGSPGGSNGDFQYKNGSSFDGSNLLRLASGFVVAHTPKIGDSNTTGHFHMHSANSAPTGINNYLTMFWQVATRALGFRSETDANTTNIQLTAPTADRTITIPDASGNVVIDKTIPEFNNGTSEGEIRLREATANGNNYVAIKSPASLSNYTVVLPSTSPAAGQVMVSDNSGNLSWTSTPGILGSQYFASTANTNYPAATALGVFVSLLIPANTFTTGNVFKIIHRATKTGTGNSIIRWGFNTANNLTGIQYITASVNITGQPGTASRHISIFTSGATTTTSFYNSALGNYTTNQSNDIIQNHVTATSTTIDWTVNQYFILAASTVAGDSFTNVFLSISPV